jgi:glycosyltransferase involved in cell wall biosynthesis
MNAQPRIGCVSTYPPRACGIATFTRDLTRAMLIRGQIDRAVVVPIEDNGTRYPASITRTIDQHNRRSYISAANFLNESDIDLVSLQHEFGIFGGEWGEYVLDLCRNIDLPLVTTFHTALRNPSGKTREIVREISQTSKAVVVTITSAADMLEKHFGVDREKIVVIQHGAALPDRVRKEYAKRQLGIPARTVLATYGLISSGKGIEFAIKSLPYLVKERPDILYLVIGETHPEVLKHEGEAYREKLTSLAKELGVIRNVHFVNHYLQEDELSLYLQATDIYLAPYLGREQVSSGTITLALAYGKAIVSTPTIFAKETLGHERGLFCKFADASSIAKCVERILDDLGLRHELERNAAKYGQAVGWTRVADKYGDIFRSAVSTQRTIAQAATVTEI